MKKMTIALFTAAAMGTSAFAVADEHATGPDIFGRVDVRASESDANDSSIDLTTTKFGVAGGVSDITGGLDASYYVRFALSDDGNSTDYAYVTLGNDQIGTFTAGKNDDLVYRFAGYYTDVYRGQAQGMFKDSSAYGAYATDVSGNDQLQYTIAVTPGLELGAAIDTNENGINRQQVGLSGSFGALSFGAVYSDRDETYAESAFVTAEDITAADSQTGSSVDAGNAVAAVDAAPLDDGDEIFIGGSIDMGVASLRGTYADRSNELKQYAVSAIVPIDDTFTATVGYEDADNDIEGIQGMVMANLGGGVDLNVGFESGDRDDLVIGGVRYTF